MILPGCCVFLFVSCHRRGSSSRECAVLEKRLLLLLGLWLCPSAAPAGFAYPHMEMDLSTRTAALHFQGAATATAPAAVAPIR